MTAARGLGQLMRSTALYAAPQYAPRIYQNRHVIAANAGRLRRSVLSQAQESWEALKNIDKQPRTAGTFSAQEKLEVVSADLQSLLADGHFDPMDPERVYADVNRLIAKLREIAPEQ